MTSRESIYSCKFCEKQVRGLKFVKKHQKVCSSNPDNKDKFFKCDPCNHSYATYGNLHKHNITCPTNGYNTKSTCEFCTKEFTQLGIENHIPHCHLNPNSAKYEPNKQYVDKHGFIDNKYTKWYFKIINSTTKDELLGYTEKHHIIPKSFGGSDDKSNLVKLSARKHYICHLLLTKMVKPNTPEYHRMIKAYVMMAKCNGSMQERSYKVSSRLFDKLKVEFNKIQSIQQSGSNNSQYGTIWVYNPTAKENKKINKNDTIPDGWFKGKVDNWNTHFTQRKCKCCGNIGTMSVNSVYCSIECRISNVVMKKDTVVRQNNIKNDINKPLIDLINERSSYDGDCLIWNKSVTTHGSPQYVYQGKNIQVHKYMYEHHNKEIVDTKTHIVKQSCGNKKCINPLHLKCSKRIRNVTSHNYEIHEKWHI